MSNDFDDPDRTQTETEIRDSEAFVRLLLNSTFEAFCAIDRAGMTTLCNDAFLKMLGFERRGEVIGRKLHDLVHHSHPDGSPYRQEDCPIFRAASRGQSSVVSDEVFFRADGTAIPIEYRAAPILRDGELQGAICSFVDITARRWFEGRQALLLRLAALQRETDDPATMMRAASEALGRHLGVNRAGFFDMIDDDTLGFTISWTDGILAPLSGTFPALGIGTRYLAEVRAERTLGIADTARDALTADSIFGKIGARSIIATPIIRGGRWHAGLYVNHASVRAWRDDEIALVHRVADLTWDAVERARAVAALRALNDTLEARVRERTKELMTAEEALRQAQKIEAIGQLTGGIAHDFNNLLTAILGNLELIEARLGSDEKLRRMVQAATRSAQRGAKLTEQLLAFSRRQHLAPKPLDLNAAVSGMSEMLARTIGGAIEVRTALADDLWPALVDTTQIEVALLNLVINARDAMGVGGTVLVTTRNVGAGATDRPSDLAPGDYVVLAVTDTGEGMTTEVLAKAFEPFFTTKEVGKGTGLGLSQVYGLARQSGGIARIRSKPGAGTEVEIYLPRAPAAASGALLSEGDGAEGSVRRRGTVLIVDDQEDVREFAAVHLETLGYQTIHASNGRAALDLLETGGGAAVDVLLVDYAMPGMSGVDVIRAVRQVRPDLPVVLMTGYADAGALSERLSHVVLLNKPFRLHELAEALEAAPSPRARRQGRGNVIPLDRPRR